MRLTLTEQNNLCNYCAYAPCFCGNDPENCVAYVQRNGIKITEKVEDGDNDAKNG